MTYSNFPLLGSHHNKVGICLRGLRFFLFDLNKCIQANNEHIVFDSGEILMKISGQLFTWNEI